MMAAKNDNTLLRDICNSPLDVIGIDTSLGLRMRGISMSILPDQMLKLLFAKSRVYVGRIVRSLLLFALVHYCSVHSQDSAS